MCFGGKTENRCETIHSNSNVSIFPSILGHDIIYPTFFDVMPTIWVCYAMFCDLFCTDLIWCLYAMICLCRCPPPDPLLHSWLFTRSDMATMWLEGPQHRNSTNPFP